jgi:hypothetical protein
MGGEAADIAALEAGPQSAAASTHDSFFHALSCMRLYDWWPGHSPSGLRHLPAG